MGIMKPIWHPAPHWYMVRRIRYFPLCPPCAESSISLWMIRKLYQNPFVHNPRRLADVGKFCDVYNSYSLGLTSYFSTEGTHQILDERNAIYGKPLLSHEIGIHGTWIDLALEERYKGTRIGDTELFSSVRRHLADKGILDRSNLYYRNSCAWQQILRI